MAKRMKMADLKDELAEVARVGQMFVDGDACRNAWAPGCECFTKGDDMNYNNPVVVPLKKTLFKLERLSRVPCSTTLWRRRPDDPESGEPLLFGSHGTPEGADKPSNWGYTPPRMTPQMRKAFVDGKPAWKTKKNPKQAGHLLSRGCTQRVTDRKGVSSVQLFVPVKDSLGEIAALLEVFTVAVGT
jgi:hypothetical protein